MHRNEKLTKPLRDKRYVVSSLDSLKVLDRELVLYPPYFFRVMHNGFLITQFLTSSLQTIKTNRQIIHSNQYIFLLVVLQPSTQRRFLEIMIKLCILLKFLEEVSLIASNTS